MNPETSHDETIFRLHIGGKEPRKGWKILDIEARPGVDFVGDCADMSAFSDGVVDELYLSHVLEHLGHAGEFLKALEGFIRVLRPGGELSLAVPDFRALCEIFLSSTGQLSTKFGVVNILFGGQKNPFDFHKSAFDEELLTHFLQSAGFVNVRRVADFGLFDDASRYEYAGRSVSLNIKANKPLDAVQGEPASKLQPTVSTMVEGNKRDALLFGPVFTIPERFVKDFSMNGRCPILLQFRHETSEGELVWRKSYWDHILPRVDRLIESGEILGYSSDPHLVAAFRSFPVAGKKVVVIGSVHPLYEALVYRMGGIPSTVEFRKIQHDIPELETFTVEEFRQSGKVFECGVTISALEHDGLGRYGDPIDPFGDIKTMRNYKSVIAKGGLMFLSVPVGQDALVWNSHRIYGAHRLPMLLEGWRILGHVGFDESLFSLGRVGEDYREPVFILENT